MDEFLSFAKSQVKDGGHLLHANFGKLKGSQIEPKGPHDLVTELDRKVEKMYVNAIRKEFPEHGIIGEEGTEINTEKQWCWVIDPLDGTRNYSLQLPFYATTMCLLKDKNPVVSVIYVPPLRKLYHAVTGKGAFLNEKPIHTSPKTDLAESSILYCHSADESGIRKAERYAASLKSKALNADRFRSAGAEMGLVAEGLAEAYLLDGLPVWDLAAGALLIKEAGGMVTDLEGKPWTTDKTNILLSNGSPIHQEILKIVA